MIDIKDKYNVLYNLKEGKLSKYLLVEEKENAKKVWYVAKYFQNEDTYKNEIEVIRSLPDTGKYGIPRLHDTG